MKLTEGQVSDYKGAVLLMDAIDALPEARELRRTVVTTPTGSVTPCAPEALRPASRPEGAGRDPARTIKICINSGTRSRSCLAGSRTGAE